MWRTTSFSLFWDSLNKICWFIVRSLLRFLLQSSPLTSLNNLVPSVKSRLVVEQSRCHYRLIWHSTCKNIFIYSCFIFYFLTSFVYVRIFLFILWLLGCFNEEEPFPDTWYADCHTSSGAVSCPVHQYCLPSLPVLQTSPQPQFSPPLLLH